VFRGDPWAGSEAAVTQQPQGEIAAARFPLPPAVSSQDSPAQPVAAASISAARKRKPGNRLPNAASADSGLGLPPAPHVLEQQERALNRPDPMRTRRPLPSPAVGAAALASDARFETASFEGLTMADLLWVGPFSKGGATAERWGCRAEEGPL